MNTYTWNVENNGLECFPTFESQINVVFKVHWKVNATDGINNVSIFGKQLLDYKKDNFVEFSNLTEEQIINWVQSAMGTDKVTEIQTQLDNMINDLANPSIVLPKLPWAI